MLYETVRNYGFSQKTVEAKNEFVAKFEGEKLVYMPVNNQIGLQKLKHLSRAEVPASKNFFAIAPRSFLKKEFESKVIDSLKGLGVKVNPGDKEYTFNDKKQIFTKLKEEGLASETMEVFADTIGHKRKLHDGLYLKADKVVKEGPSEDEMSDNEQVEVTDVHMPRKKRARQLEASEDEDKDMPAVKEEEP